MSLYLYFFSRKIPKVTEINEKIVPSRDIANILQNRILFIY